MKTATLKIQVSYDEERTDPESLAAAADTIWALGWSRVSKETVADYGPLAWEEFLVAGDRFQQLRVGDEARGETPPLDMRVSLGVYGPSIEVYDDAGVAMATVRVDYFDNKLQVLTWYTGRDDPDDEFVLCEDVAAERLRPHEEDPYG